jgi:hypothetical protein
MRRCWWWCYLFFSLLYLPSIVSPVPQGILAAPLIMGNDLRKMSPGSIQILQNRMAVQINQDPLGKAGSRLSEFGAQEVWSRDLISSSIDNAQRFAVALLNKGEGHADITVEFKDVSALLHQARVLDVWSQSLLGTFSDRYEHTSHVTRHTSHVTRHFCHNVTPCFMYTAKAVPPHGTPHHQTASPSPSPSLIIYPRLRPHSNTATAGTAYITLEALA